MNRYCFFCKKPLTGYYHQVYFEGLFIPACADDRECKPPRKWRRKKRKKNNAVLRQQNDITLID